jgi:hypothetical protein
MAESEPTKDFKPYHYDPSLAAASISAILFLTTSSVHVWQMFKHKTWFFVAFIIGGLCKKEAPSTLPGHFPLPRWEKMLTASTSRVHRLRRAYSAREAPDFTLGPYITQSLLLLLGPSFFAASIYMVLGRIIRLTGGENHSPIRPSRLTKIFVLGDVLSFFVQSGGECFSKKTFFFVGQFS